MNQSHIDKLREAADAADTMLKKPESVLAEADRIIHGERAKQYGDARESFDRIAGMWSAYLGYPVSGPDVCNMMTLLKVSRAKQGYHRDSYVDICGYAALAEQLANRAVDPFA